MAISAAIMCWQRLPAEIGKRNRRLSPLGRRGVSDSDGGSPQAEAERKLATLAEKIRSYPFSYDGHLIRVTMTFGLTYGRIGADFEAVVELADQRMYQGKRQGKDRIVF